MATAEQKEVLALLEPRTFMLRKYDAILERAEHGLHWLEDDDCLEKIEWSIPWEQVCPELRMSRVPLGVLEELGRKLQEDMRWRGPDAQTWVAIDHSHVDNRLHLVILLTYGPTKGHEVEYKRNLTRLRAHVRKLKDAMRARPKGTLMCGASFADQVDYTRDELNGHLWEEGLTAVDYVLTVINDHYDDTDGLRVVIFKWNSTSAEIAAALDAPVDGASATADAERTVKPADAAIETAMENIKMDS